jgi:ABC transport system ATP-binding/permease protein
MALVTLQQINLSHGGPNLLQDLTISIEAGDRLCLVGRNGVGKSTLLRLIAGQEQPDSGIVALPEGVQPVYLPQEPALKGHHTAPGRNTDVYRTILGVEQENDPATMSGGELRRTLLAGVLAAESEVLLLDEPTNHLDIETIRWLEEHLMGPGYRGRAVVFVTHDRAFARRVANRVGELDRGTLRLYDEDYDTFLRRQEDRFREEERQEKEFAKKLAREEAWLRKGTRARRTRDEGRVRALLTMRKEFSERRSQIGSARLNINEGDRSGDIVIDAEDLAFQWRNADSPLFAGLSTTILRGDRLGIVGPNGAGKTTLIRLILNAGGPETSGSGECTGRLKRGTGLEVVYFDQLREQLDPSATLFHAMGDGYETITVGTSRRHVSAYLKDFLFSETDMNRPLETLSGGERNRLLLARLFARPSNVLVLDEPTNDLDTDTLDLLEDRLAEYSGTVLLVSHDREFLDNIVAGCIVLPGDGSVLQYAGGYSDWKDRYQDYLAGKSEKVKQKDRNEKPRDRARKLSFHEQREIEELPGRIESMESEKAEIHALLADPGIYRSSEADPGALTRRLAELDTEIEAAMARWEHLEEIDAASARLDTQQRNE